ncbi:MAG: cytochrome c family protein [Rhodospirillales bacterium]|nr:cytochrome c family protein [Rhodospirillales bacterium]
MHFSFLEKFGLSLLIVAWVIFGANFLGNTLVSVTPHTAAVEVAALDTATDAQEAAPVEEIDILPMIAAADPTDGQKVFGKCKACHTVDKGGANGVGPNLWAIVGAPHAHIDGFNYSSAIADLKDKPWSYEELDAFLEAPKKYAPGTKMTFAGLRKPEDRAAVIAYLRTLDDNPKPLP